MNSSLNNITLTNDLLINLYKNYLVADPTVEPVVAKEKTNTKEKKEIKHQGKNKKNILVLIKKNAGLDFLKKMLTPCQLSFNDVAIVDTKDFVDKKFEEVSEIFNAKSVLLFDVSPTEIDLPINFPQYQVQKYLQMQILYLPDLQEIENSVAHKKDTWNGLRKIFLI